MKTAQNFLTIDLEVAGPAAMFARPDTGATPISYPVPTYSAAKGMFETVLRRTNITLIRCMWKSASLFVMNDT